MASLSFCEILAGYRQTDKQLGKQNLLSTHHVMTGAALTSSTVKTHFLPGKVWGVEVPISCASPSGNFGPLATLGISLLCP